MGGLVVNAATEQNGDRQFRAFVSYSHADKAAAQKLHRKLEAYRLPKHLLSDEDAEAMGGRIGPIFRDREDLPAAEDLTESVKEALAQSGALVVLCSPNAQKSPWVAREIELFRQLHPDRPVLAALLDGEPEEAFPAPLRDGREPLAADLRKTGDGPRLGFLKVVAGIAGVPLDALVNRDAQRRVKRVTAITVAAIAAMVVMALMTTFAIQQRNEAQAQREAAEGLVEFMLTDLREDLEGTAGVSVLTKANQRALQFYEDQGSLETLPPDSLARRARVIGNLGEDAESRRDFALARRNYEERLRTTSSLLADDPDSSERQFDHARSLNRLAVLDQKTGNNDAARTGLAESWALLDRLKDSKKHDVEVQRTITLLAGNLCAMDALGKAVNDETLVWCASATDVGAKLAQVEGPASVDPYNLAFNLMWESEALEQSGDAAKATERRRNALTLSERLMAENPDNRKIASQRMEILGFLSERYGLDDQITMMTEAIIIAERLVTMDPAQEERKQKLEYYRNKLKGLNDGN